MKRPQVNSRARILRGLQGDKVSIEMVRVVGTIGAIRVSTLYYAQAHRHCPSHPQAAPSRTPREFHPYNRASNLVLPPPVVLEA